MTDLSDFGGGIDTADLDDDSDQEATDSSSGTGYGRSHDYRNGRCKAITTDGTRCRSPRMFRDDFCHTHKGAHDPVSIEDTPRELIEATTRTLWRNFEHDQIPSAVAEVTQADD